MAATKVDYDLLETEYVTGDVSVRELGRRHDISYSAVADQARKRGWEDKRAAYRDSLSQRTYERTADKWAAQRAEINDELITVQLATIRAYARQLVAGNVDISVKDMTLAVNQLLLMLGEPTSRTEAKVLGVNVSANASDITPDLLRRLAEVARGRLAGSDVEVPVGLLTTGSRPN